ncbi:MAG: 3-oxoacid CoA-transferase [Deltaproteobacteria bacterium]|nr:3-oxoacid CoA-transferase [Deltaproteobacteria bacterium]MBI2341437.1 3-oxoacid CoA-transferase [Deltaproteobacteria bacterium]MBI2974596.1 3-oxoacid CoA-transferase [Deltaproteobacteria bacterium]
MQYSPNELLICLAARMMEDNSTAFIGTGIPMLAASLAQKLYSPNLVPVFEFGGTGAILEKLPLAVGDMRTFNKALHASGICDIMETAQRGIIEYGFLGGAQIDCYGNLNSTVIGSQSKPKVRLPGSGGANDVGSHCWKTIILMQHDTRRFMPKIDFVTTPGFLTGPGAREKAGLPKETGPYRVVTTLAVMDFEPKSKRMRLIATNPGVTVGDVVKNTGFELLMAEKIQRNEPPQEKELHALRDEIDKDRLYI